MTPQPRRRHQARNQRLAPNHPPLEVKLKPAAERRRKRIAGCPEAIRRLVELGLRAKAK
jgi:hypothetical protein